MRTSVFAALSVFIAACDTPANVDDGAPSVADAGHDDADAGGPRDGGATDGGSNVDGGAPSWAVIKAQYDIIQTVAGAGAVDLGNDWSPTMEGGRAVDAELSRPHLTMSDGLGRLYIADKEAHAIRRVELDGTIVTVAGTNVAGFDGDGEISATSARLSSPNGLWVNSDGTFYIYDLGNDRVRRVTATGTMTTLFVVGGSGEGRGLYVNDDESKAYVAASTQVKMWTPENGVVVVAAGFSSLGNLVVDHQGRLLVTERGAHRVSIVDDDGTVSAFAGNGGLTGGGDGQLAIDTALVEVRGVFPHPEAGVFLCTHEGGQVWYVDNDGVIHLFVDGNGGSAFSGDGMAYDAPGEKISEPRSVSVAVDGSVIITESDNGRVRRVRRRAP